MKLFHKALLYSTTAAILLVTQTGLAHADKGGGGRAGSSGSTTRMSSGGGSMKMSQGSMNSSLKKSINSSSTVKPGNGQTLNKTAQNTVQKQNVTQAKNKVNGTVNLNSSQFSGQKSFAKVGSTPSVQNGFKHTPQYFGNKSNYFCGTPWTSGGCFPSHHHHGHWNYCGFGYGFGWNSCWSYPLYNQCYYPCYYSCCTPCYDYCSPVCYAYQPPVVITQKVIEVMQTPPVVEAVTNQTTTTDMAIKQPSVELSFLTSSVTRP